MSKTKNNLFYMHVVIYFLLTFGIGYIPYSGLPEIGMKVLGVFVGLIYGWTFMGFIWPSCMSILALGFTGYDTPFKILASGFSNEVTIFLLLTMIYTAYCEESGLSEKIAYWFLSRKIIAGRPWVFAFIVLLATYVLSICIGGTQGLLLIWAMSYGIYNKVGYQKLDAFPAYVSLGAVFAAVASFSAKPWTGLPLITLGNLNSISEGKYELPFFEFMFIASAIFVVAFVLYLLLVKVLIKPDTTPFTKNENLEIFADMRNHLSMNKRERVAGISFIIFLVLLFLPSFVPSLKIISMNVAVLIVIIGLCIYQIDGKPAINFQKCASTGIMWNVILMVASMLPLTSALGSEKVGIVAWLNTLVGSTFDGMSTTFFLIIIVVLTIVLTQVAHNAMTASITLALGYPVSLTLGVDPLVMTILIAYAAGLAMATPAASTSAAIGFANTEWIGTNVAFKGGLMCVIVGTICVIAIGIPLTALML